MNNFVSGLMLVMGTFLLGLGIGVMICSSQFGERWWAGIALTLSGVFLELSLMVISHAVEEKEKKLLRGEQK
jgi:hypothetical protein